VYFRSRDLHKLPWTTTKDAVHVDSPLYQQALAQMRIQARPILDFLSNMYPGDLEAQGAPERRLLDSAISVSVDKLPQKNTAFTTIPPKTHEPTEVNVLLKVPRHDIERIRTWHGKPSMSAKKAVEHCIQYFLKKEC
jgi:hypothetical protein